MSVEELSSLVRQGVVRKIGRYYFMDTFVCGYQMRSIRRIEFGD